MSGPKAQTTSSRPMRCVSPMGWVVHPTPGDHRRHDLGVEVFPRIAVEHDEVGVMAGDQRAAPALVACEPCRRDARGAERLVDREALLRMPRVARVDRAPYAGADPGERVELLDRRV